MSRPRSLVIPAHCVIAALVAVAAGFFIAALVALTLATIAAPCPPGLFC